VIDSGFAHEDSSVLGDLHALRIGFICFLHDVIYFLLSRLFQWEWLSFLRIFR
jgi:hypothetical protein